MKINKHKKAFLPILIFILFSIAIKDVSAITITQAKKDSEVLEHNVEEQLASNKIAVNNREEIIISEKLEEEKAKDDIRVNEIKSKKQIESGRDEITWSNGKKDLIIIKEETKEEVEKENTENETENEITDKSTEEKENIDLALNQENIVNEELQKEEEKRDEIKSDDLIKEQQEDPEGSENDYSNIEEKPNKVETKQNTNKENLPVIKNKDVNITGQNDFISYSAAPNEDFVLVREWYLAGAEYVYKITGITSKGRQKIIQNNGVVIIPQSPPAEYPINDIGDEVFMNNKDIKSIEGEDIRFITGDKAFYNANNLVSVNFPNLISRKILGVIKHSGSEIFSNSNGNIIDSLKYVRLKGSDARGTSYNTILNDFFGNQSNKNKIVVNITSDSISGQILTEDFIVIKSKGYSIAIYNYKSKTNKTGEVGVQFILLDKNGNQVGKPITTNNTGFLYFPNLDSGTYKLIRIKEGILSEEEVFLSERKPSELLIYYGPPRLKRVRVELPATGGPGISIILLLISFLIILGKKKNQKQNF